jgi:hypothetical protein
MVAENLRQIADTPADLLDATELAQVRRVVHASIDAPARAGAASHAAGPEWRPEFESVGRLFTQTTLLAYRKAALARAIEAMNQGTALVDI